MSGTTMKILLLTSACCITIATVLPFIRSNRWWIRIFDFPRFQLLLAAVVVAVCYYWYWDPMNRWENILLIAFGAATLYQTYMVHPYTILAPYQVQTSTRGLSPSSVNLMISNVLMFNRNSDLVLGNIWKQDPDIVALVEPDSWWERAMQPLEKEYPYTVKIPKENTYGMALYSKLPLRDSRIRYLVDDDIPSIHTLVELRTGDVIELFCVHPKPPHPWYAESTAFRDAELLMLGKEVRRARHPVIVVGDLNDVAWSDTTILFKRISGLLDPRIGRGLYNTFHAGLPFFRWPLDHVFHTRHFKLQSIGRLPSIQSDHFPVAISLSLEAVAEHEQRPPRANAGHHREAQARIAEAEQVIDFGA